MQIGCDTFLKALEQWATLSYAEDWDNCGLQVGRRDKVIGKVMIALTPGEAAIQAAVDAKVDLLLTHHPMIFSPLSSVITLLKYFCKSSTRAVINPLFLSEISTVPLILSIFELNL